MKIPKMMEALQQVDEDLIQEAMIEEKKRSKHWIPGAVSMAACLCIAMIGMMVWKWHTGPESVPSEQVLQDSIATEEQVMQDLTVTEEGVTIPQMQVTLNEEEMAAACMVGFFIYEGRVYIHYETIYEEIDVIEAHLGTITGGIDAWTPADGYVDGAGSTQGEIYSVRGYDPAFMLCMKDPDLATRLFVCNNGITLKKGSDLFEDRLHLEGNYENVQFETRGSWYMDRGERYQLEADHALIQELIRQMKEAPIQASDREMLIDQEEYHLYLNRKDGISIHLRLSQGGYVRYDGLMEVCVQIPEELYGDLLDLFTKERGHKIQYETGYGLWKTLEECEADPELGSFVPQYIPERFVIENAYIHYYLDKETGEKTGTQMVDISWNDAEISQNWLWIQLTWMKEYGSDGWEGTVVDAAQLTQELVDENIEKEEGWLRSMGITYGDVMVRIGGSGVSAEEVYEILQSIQN